MKRKILALAVLSGFFSAANATDLLEVYQQALSSDPIYQQALSQRLFTKEGVPISAAALLPNVSLAVVPSITRTANSGAQTAGIAALTPRNNTARAYTVTLTATQTIFNYTQFTTVAGAVALSKGADAILNAALQDLMIRVSTAYFAVLNDEDNLSYTEASKVAYAEQLDQVKQQYNVGLKTITDVYTAQAAYDSAVATYIQAQTTLANDKENLRVITGKYYPNLSSLSESFPLVRPKPMNVETWVQLAQCQNWNVKSNRYNVDNALQVVRQNFGGHLPTVTLQGIMDRLYTNNISSNRNLDVRTGPSMTTNREVAFNINVPIFEGGGVVAATNQAVYGFQIAQQTLEQVVRNTINATRQSYLNVISGISQISADREAIKSSISSLEGMEESYRVGTETLVDVLNQQQKVYEAQTQYANDRYGFVKNVLLLKQAAGTLSFDDLRAINAWLIEKEHVHIRKKRYPVYTFKTPTSKKHLAQVSHKKIDAKTTAKQMVATNKKVKKQVIAKKSITKKILLTKK